MTINRFFSEYTITKAVACETPLLNDSVATLEIVRLATGVYNDGLYVILCREEAAQLTKLIEAVFPTAAGSVTAFAADWMGRVFATDTSILDPRRMATVTCFDFAEPSSFATDASFVDFHDSTAVDMKSELFNLMQFQGWAASNPLPSDGSSCVGYRIPLFLGGTDSQDNMELGDRSVYIHLLAQLWQSSNSR